MIDKGLRQANLKEVILRYLEDYDDWREAQEALIIDYQTILEEEFGLRANLIVLPTYSSEINLRIKNMLTEISQKL